MLQSDPIGFVLYLFYLLVTVLLSLILHEVAHGYVAYRCGDATAKWMGRLSLDPRKHLDPIGTICMFLFGIGWAKPVPVNPRNFHNYRRDDFMVSIAGIVTNLSLFVLCTALAVGVNAVMFKPEFLNRIDEIMVFHSLNKENIRKIVTILLKNLEKRCQEQLDIILKVTGAAKDLIADAGFDSKYGARPLRRAIQTKIEDEMATEILEGRIKAGDTVQVKVKDKKIYFEVKDAEKA